MLRLKTKIINGKLQFDKNSAELYKNFMDSVIDDMEFFIIIEEIGQEKTLDQLNKVHKMIRTLAQCTGTTFDEMKLIVKERCGMKIGDNYLSFKDSTKDDLIMVIEELKKLYTFNNIIYKE